MSLPDNRERFEKWMLPEKVVSKSFRGAFSGYHGIAHATKWKAFNAGCTSRDQDVTAIWRRWHDEMSAHEAAQKKLAALVSDRAAIIRELCKMIHDDQMEHFGCVLPDVSGVLKLLEEMASKEEAVSA